MTAENLLNKVFSKLLEDFENGISSTSTKKFDDVRKFFSELLNIGFDDIYAVSAGTRPTNLPIRLTQGDQSNRSTKLGLAFVTVEKDISSTVDSSATSIRNYLSSKNRGKYDSILIIPVENDIAHPMLVMYKEKGEDLANLLQNKFPDLQTEQLSLKDTGNSGSQELSGTNCLRAKPFLIFSGLSGSGKSRAAKQIAQSFSSDSSHYHFAAVGPDWNNRDPLLGYPDGIHSTVYQSTPVLELLIRAAADQNQPYFLILDEMNLSHVERYFADFLSAMESDEEITLYEGTQRGSYEKNIRIPQNFFIIGTVNIDETTYQFSPKVLDRANVIEFKMYEGDVERFFSGTTDGIASGALAHMAAAFVEDAKIADDVAVAWAAEQGFFKDEMQALFDLLQQFNGEFGYRTLKECSRYLYFHDKYSELEGDEKYSDGMDRIIIQKLLPKLHGSRSKLEGILRALLYFCENPDREDLEELKTDALTAATETNISLDMLGKDINGHYKLSHDKLRRMCKKLHQDQFVSFADA